MSTPFSSMAWVMSGGVVGSVGAVGLKAGASRLKLSILGLLSNWQLIGGVVLYMLSSVLYSKGMADGQANVLFPLVALAQVWTMIWAAALFGEKITRHKLIAVGLIIGGVLLIAYGNSQLANITL